MTQGEALAILKTGANVFLTGSPGSGKTYVVNQYVAWLRTHNIEPSITASTGIAATHIHGMTIHSWSGIGITERVTEMDLDRIAAKEHVAKRLMKAKVLIIDEISMLSGAALDSVDAVLRTVRRTDRSFGGLQIVFVGDFFQLPPIARAGSRAIFAFDSDAWRAANPLTCYLTQQYRQDDPIFLEILRALREDASEPGHISRIVARETMHEDVDEEVPRLFTHNLDVDRINEEKLERLPGTSKRYVMEGTGSAALVESLKRGCLSPETLALKVGAVVMCTKNNPAAGYVNGTLGKIIGFERGTNQPIIETRDGRTLTMAPVDWAVEEGGKVRAKVTQIPLRLAWAITIHKSQGMSMDEAAIDLSRAFEYGQGYVALSRVRRLSGLHLLGWSDDALKLHPDVIRKDQEFQEASETAGAAFNVLEETGERAQMEKNFILASGGTLETVVPTKGSKGSKLHTHDETLGLIQEGTLITNIAKERKLTFGTIVDHVEKLTAAGRLKRGEVLAVLPPRLEEHLATIHEAFDALGADRLTPVFARLKKRFTFDELRLARAVLPSKHTKRA